jgi:hypothetical protein
VQTALPGTRLQRRKRNEKGEQTTSYIRIRRGRVHRVVLCRIASHRRSPRFKHFLYIYSFVGSFPPIALWDKVSPPNSSQLLQPIPPSLYPSIPSYPVYPALPYLPDWEPTIQGKHLPSSTYYLRPSLPVGTPVTTVLLFHVPSCTFLLLSFFPLFSFFFFFFSIVVVSIPITIPIPLPSQSYYSVSQSSRSSQSIIWLAPLTRGHANMRYLLPAQPTQPSSPTPLEPGPFF